MQAENSRVAYSVEFELRIYSENATRDRHWSYRKRRAEYQKIKTRAALGTHQWRSFPATVTLTRLGPRRMDEDNAIAGLKAVRDAVARWLGVDDGDPVVSWKYAQAHSKDYRVKISISS